ncbi:hypothetical protein ACP2W0_14355 [Pseudobacillus badius]|uniref:hypothetical protein n=1 Tax=Bacillus badius TaxID=1455 RepID=UPI003CED66D7
MNQFLTLLVCLIGMPIAGFLVYRLLERLMKHIDVKEEEKKKLAELNQLGECSHCGRLSRIYQRELARCSLLLSERPEGSPSLPCPHCKQEADYFPVPAALPFHDTHPDCLPLQKSEYAEYYKEKEQWAQLLYLSKPARPLMKEEGEA